jgi:solute carrier family 35 protein C2
METISVTFYTMVKASAPIFASFSAVALGIEKITFPLVVTVSLITGGELLTAFGEVEFDTTGFVLCMVSTVCAGIRWVIVQYTLEKLDPPVKGPIAIMRLMSSTMFFSTLLLSLIIEQPWNVFMSEAENATDMVSFVLGGASLAIAANLCQYWLILKSNAIVMMIGSVLKGLVTIFIG